MSAEEGKTKADFNFNSDTFKIEKKGITFKFFRAQNTRTPHLIFAMTDKKGNSMSIGMNEELSSMITRILQRMISEM